MDEQMQTPLQRWLDKREMTQADLARALDFDRAVISKVARGVRRASGEFRYRFAKMTRDFELTEQVLSQPN